MGEIEAREGHPERSTRYWREASDMAKRMRDKTLRFKAEFLLFRQAHQEGNKAVARAIARRLVRLSNWVPSSLEELHEFRQLAS